MELTQVQAQNKRQKLNWNLLTKLSWVRGGRGDPGSSQCSGIGTETSFHGSMLL